LGSDKGHCAMWVRSEENNASSSKDNLLFDFIRCWKLSTTELAPVLSMDVNTQEEYLSLSCKNNNIYLVNIKSIGLNESMEKEVKIDQVSKGFHSGGITSMDIAVQ
jgi:hypothetical protein